MPCSPFSLVHHKDIKHQATRSGKSAVPLTCAVVDDEVSIIVENTLSLGSDQVGKVNLTVSQSAKNAKASSEKHLWGHCFFLTANQPI